MPETTAPHTLSLQNRSKLNLTGVTEVVSFDDTSVILRTPLGTLLIQGSQLQLKTLTLDGGNVTVEGDIAALSYEEPRSAGLLGRFFR